MNTQGDPEDDDVVWVHQEWPKDDPCWIVGLQFSVVDGRVRCTGQSVTALGAGRPFTASVLRGVPFPQLIDEALDNPTREMTRMAGLPPFTTFADLSAVGLDLMRRSPAKAPRRGRPVSYASAHYARVAEVYRTAHRRPTQVVAEEFGVTRTTAANWVRKARQLGFLAPKGSLSRRETTDEHR